MRRILSLLAVPAVLAGLIAAGEAPEAASVEADCLQITVGAPDMVECETTGAQSHLGTTTFEPTMHADGDGNLFYASTLGRGSGVAIGFGAGVHASFDGGQTWEDKTPRVAGRPVPPETNDPYVYVDPLTGRVFSFHMSPVLTCSILSFSDDLGESWTTNPLGCGPTGAWDHQTIVAAPPTDGVATFGYPNVLVQCVNTVYAAECARSLDGGLTWGHTVPAYLSPGIEGAMGNSNASGVCGAMHGHLLSDLEGNIYLPTSMCGDRPMVYISRDSGLTWSQSIVSQMDIPFTDPTAAVDRDGNLYVSWVDNQGRLYLSVSTDQGESWSDAVLAAPSVVTATMPAMIAGDPGRIAIAYPGTKDIPGGFGAQMTEGQKRAIEWGGYITWSSDALAEAPTFQTVNATGADPLMRGDVCVSGGRCNFQVDFIEATVTPDGKVWASFADGCTNAACIEKGKPNNETGSWGQAVAVTLHEADLCEARCDRFGGQTEPASFVAHHLLPSEVDIAAAAAAEVAPLAFDGTSLVAMWRDANVEKLAWATGTR